MSRRGTQDHQKTLGPERRDLFGRIRRMAIGVTSRVLWQLLGHKTEGETETVDVEIFPGIGFYARPRTTDRAEAIVVNVGGAKHPAVVATRNEDVRKEIAELGADETAIFNSQVTIHLVGDQVHVRTAGGAAVALVTVAEYNGHTHTYTDGATPLVTGGAAAVTGTTVLKGQ